MCTSTKFDQTSRRCAAPIAIVLTAAGLIGCANAGQGAFSGAGIGAAGGAIIGSIFGEAGAGAAIGAVTGAVTGGVIGDQNQRREREAILSRPVVIEQYGYAVIEERGGRPYRNRDEYLRRNGG